VNFLHSCCWIDPLSLLDTTLRDRIALSALSWTMYVHVFHVNERGSHAHFDFLGKNVFIDNLGSRGRSCFFVCIASCSLIGNKTNQKNPQKTINTWKSRGYSTFKKFTNIVQWAWCRKLSQVKWFCLFWLEISNLMVDFFPDQKS